MFPLPNLSQEQFSSFYGKKTNNNETIVYPGIKLPCSTKNKNIKRHIGPKHVFIVKSNGTFTHRILGSDNQWSVLPKRLHSVCFPKVHLASIPDNNRIKIQLTDTIFETLPFVPDEFYKQKVKKAKEPNKPVTRRNKRKRLVNSARRVTEPYEGWKIEGIAKKPNKISKNTLIGKIRTCVDIASDKVIGNPFDANLSSDEAKRAFTTVVQFVHHYAREEFNMQIVEKTHDNTVWSTIEGII
tara:strand:- start:402 stop:1124 length:723 start_codon:yes stop_codon:yes gene_type:complete